MKRIPKFRPFYGGKAPFVAPEFPKEIHLSTRGRWALFHILKSLGFKKALLPIYACDKLLYPFQRLGIQVDYVDIDTEDLNPSFKSIEAKLRFQKYDVIVVPSLYGNPANLSAIESLCKHENVFLIDDAAQSFGSILEGKRVGSFGNAGFVSFSPGKPIDAHMGALFWSKNNVLAPTDTISWLSALVFFDYYLNRVQILATAPFKVFAIVRKVVQWLEKKLESKFMFCTLTDKDLSIIGGSLKALESNLQIRKSFIKEIQLILNNLPAISLVSAVRGDPSPVKVVLLARSKEIKSLFIRKLLEKDIYFSHGYAPLTADLSDYQGMASVNGKIIEIPIDPDPILRKYLSDALKEFVLETQDAQKGG